MLELLYFILILFSFYFFPFILFFFYFLDNKEVYDLLWTSAYEEILYYNQKICKSILVSFSTRSYSFDNTFNSTPTKLFQISRKWRCWTIPLGVCCPIINDYYTECVYYLLLSMDFLYSTSKVSYYSIPLKSLEKYNRELSYGSLKPFTLHLHGELRLLLASFLYTFI